MGKQSYLDDDDDGEEKIRRWGKTAGFIFGGLFLLSFLLGSFYTIDQGERGVILCNGAVCGMADPGLHFKIPFIQTVKLISVQSQKVVYADIKTYSRDQQPAILRVSLNLRATDVMTVYKEYQTYDNMLARAVQPQVYTWAENTFGQFNAESAVQDRAKFNAELSRSIRKVLKGPFVIESIQIETIDFSDSYEAAVEDRMKATVKKQQAQAVAEATKTTAEAQAFATRVQGDAEASAIRARGAALRDNPGLPALTAAEKWDGKLPRMMVPSSGVPMLDISKLAK